MEGVNEVVATVLTVEGNDAGVAIGVPGSIFGILANGGATIGVPGSIFGILANGGATGDPVTVVCRLEPTD